MIIFRDNKKNKALNENAELKRKLKEIHPYENNPRIIEGAIDDVAESIRQCSYITPIVTDEDGVILAGHTRYVL